MYDATGHMAGSIIRYLSLTQLAAKFGLYNESAYLINFIAATFGKLLRIGLFMIFFDSIALVVVQVPSWTRDGLLTIIATFFIVDLVASILFHRNLLFHLPEHIQDGTFDRYVVRPAPTLFQVSFRVIDIGDVVTLVPFIIFWGWMVSRFPAAIGTGAIFGYIGMMVVAVVFLYALVLLIGSISFWTVRGDGAGRLTDYMAGAASFPLDIFAAPFRQIAFWVVPVAILSVVPAQVLFGTASLMVVGYSILFTVVLLCIALRVWNRGVRRYDSASS